MPRLGAKKSRNGCVQCKARRVKCDEQRPCGACAKHHVECSLLGRPGVGSHVLLPSPHTNAPSPHALTPPTSSEPVRSPAGSAGEGPITPSSTFSSSANQYGTVPTQVTLAPLPSSQWMQDLELMHHYTAHAYLTLPGIQSTKEIWGYAVPQEAFRFPYLMHSILAFSANHLAYLKPAQSAHYRVLAGTHQSVALTSLQSTITEIQIANCQAVFVSALLTIYNAFADAQTHSLDVLFDLFQVVRGMNIVSDRRLHIIQEGPFAAIIAPTLNPPTPQPLLSSILVELQAADGSLHDGATPIQIACMKATTILRQALKHAMETTPHPALRTMLYWPNVLDAEFLEMLKQRSDPCLRELMARYCQIMEFAASSFWFMNGWRGISQRT